MAKKKNRVLNFFRETKGELKKVVWPSFKQVKNNTFIVIICVLIIGAFIWLLDIGFTTTLSLVNPPEYTKAEYKDAGINYNMFFRTFTDEDSKEKITESEADAKVLSAKSGEEASGEGTTMTEEEYQAFINSMLEDAGVKYDEATQKYTDVETGAELTEEEVTERLSAVAGEVTGEVTGEETPEEGTETPDETNTGATE